MYQPGTYYFHYEYFFSCRKKYEMKTRQRKICSHVTRIQAKECVSRYTIILNVLARNNR